MIRTKFIYRECGKNWTNLTNENGGAGKLKQWDANHFPLQYFLWLKKPRQIF